MNQKEQALQLSKQGKSIREIAYQLGIGKSTVARWLQEKSSKTTINQSSIIDPSIQLEMRKMELQHELELKKLAQQEKELEMRRNQSIDQDRSKGIELRKILLPIQKWASLQLKLMSRYPDGAVPCTYQDILTMQSQLSRYEETLSDYVRIHQLDEWDDCLDILKELIAKTEEWLGQLDQMRDNLSPFSTDSDENWEDEDDFVEYEEDFDQDSDENQVCSYSWKAFEADLMFLEDIF